MPLSVAIVFAAACVVAEGATRTLTERQRDGECVKKEKHGQSLFAIDDLEENFGIDKEAMVDLDYPITSAELIELDYGPNFKVLTEKFAKEQYVLTQCGTEQPTDEEINNIKALPADFTRKFFTIPLQEVRAESTVQLSYLEILGVQDRVAHVSGYAVGPCWQKTISCGGLAVDSYSNATLMAMQRESMEAVFADCAWDYATNAPNCANINDMPNAIHFSASQDPSPIHSAEHIKFMAAFFNKEAAAWPIFQSKVDAMQRLKARMSEMSNDEKPVVAWIEKTWDGKFMLSTPDYQKLLTEYAGGTFVDSEAVMDATVDMTGTTDGPAFFEALKDVDAVIDLTYSYDATTYDLNSFFMTYGLDASSDLKFLQNEMVIRVDGQISGVSNLDWFESRLVHPDLAVLGLMRVLHPGSTEEMKFFRNIAAGEEALVVHEDECTKTMVSCESSKFPSMLPMIDDLSKVIDCDNLPAGMSCPDAKQKKKRGSKRRQARGKTGKTQKKTGKSAKKGKKTESKNSKKGKNGKK